MQIFEDGLICGAYVPPYDQFTCYQPPKKTHAKWVPIQRYLMARMWTTLLPSRMSHDVDSYHFLLLGISWGDLSNSLPGSPARLFHGDDWPFIIKNVYFTYIHPSMQFRDRWIFTRNCEIPYCHQSQIPIQISNLCRAGFRRLKHKTRVEGLFVIQSSDRRLAINYLVSCSPVGLFLLWAS